MKPLIIGITGGSGSGKSTVARRVAEQLSTRSVAFIDMDAYYHNHAHASMEQLRAIYWDHPDAFDCELLVSQLQRADADLRRIRRIRRDTNRRGRPLEEILDQYINTVHPTHLQFVEPSTRYADIIVPHGSHNAVAMGLIVARIRQRIEDARA